MGFCRWFFRRGPFEDVASGGEEEEQEAEEGDEEAEIDDEADMSAGDTVRSRQPVDSSTRRPVFS